MLWCVHALIQRPICICYAILYKIFYTILYYAIQGMIYTVTAYMLAGPGAHTLLYVPCLYVGKMCNPRLN